MNLVLQASPTQIRAGVVSGIDSCNQKLKLISNQLHAIRNLITKEIGPLSGTTDIGVIAVTIPAEQPKSSFSGEILDCGGQPMQNGYADIGFAGVFERAPVVNGILNYSYFRCGIIDTKASFRITDVGNNTIGDLQEVDLPEIQAISELLWYVKVHMKNT